MLNQKCKPIIIDYKSIFKLLNLFKFLKITKYKIEIKTIQVQYRCL